MQQIRKKWLERVIENWIIESVSDTPFDIMDRARAAHDTDFGDNLPEDLCSLRALFIAMVREPIYDDDECKLEMSELGRIIHICEAAYLLGYHNAKEGCGPDMPILKLEEVV